MNKIKTMEGTCSVNQNQKIFDFDPEVVASNGLDVEDYTFNNIYDWRNVRQGLNIPAISYSDQPYIVKTDDGAWLCVITTGSGKEGEPGQHTISMRSTDNGKSWSDPVPLEPVDGPEASYATLLKTPYGRIYCFYDHNTDNVREIIADKDAYPSGFCKRVDSLGYYVFKYTDDGGKTWSDKRHVVDVREMEIDRNNTYKGKIRFFWNVGKPFTDEGNGYVPLHKVGSIGKYFFTKSEGVLLKSANILTEKDPEKITWETLPEGEIGLRTPPGGGAIAEEQSFSVLSDGSFFCVYRTVDGHPVCTYSRDKGKTWSTPQYMTYTYQGRKLKHPRAANFAWKCSNGQFLYWFHNHGGKNYESRNPVWLCVGHEKDTPEGLQIEWSQPEILIYDDDPFIRMSYPDMVEEDGCFYVTETQKHLARLHQIDPDFMKTLFQFPTINEFAQKGLIVDLASIGQTPAEFKMPDLPKFRVRNLESKEYGGLYLRNGVTLDICFKLSSLHPGQNLLDNTNDEGRGFCIETDKQNTLRVTLNDGVSQSSWTLDPDILKTDHLHHVIVIIDSGPKIMTFLVDGQLCDGGEIRQYGWCRFSSEMLDINGRDKLIVGKEIEGSIKTLRIYNRAIMTTEAVGNYRAAIRHS